MTNRHAARIPLMREAGAVDQRVTAGGTVPMSRKILIVDDDAGFLSWLKFGLEEKENFEVVAAETVREGSTAFEASVFDLVIIDIKLPDGDGFELCRKVKMHNATVPVILVTGVFKEFESWQKGNKVGMNDLLIKPFSYENMVQRVERLLKKSTLGK